jgi:hypothetical protein
MKTITISALAAVLSLSLVGSLQANPTIRERGGFEQDEQSPAGSDVAMSDHVSHILSSSPELSSVHGNVSVTTVSEHTVILRGTVGRTDDRDKIKAALQGSVGSYQVQDDLMERDQTATQ